MKVYRFHRSIKLPINISDAWEYFSDPRNLSMILPPSLGFRILDRLPRYMYAGMIIQYRIRPMLAIPLTWITEITHIEEPGYFVDVQHFGPFKFWHHQHMLTEVAGGVEIEDTVHYSVPIPLLGRLVNLLFVGRKLRSIFDFRDKALRKLFMVR